ncbi:peptidoglycan glycosyltransferase [Lachnospiraceae bacterium AM25-11LB]|jgi:stage V sporulation protein D (sporulation-specific penicillin-binding protein)|uniref:peptidoglycan D,D-transpeptidase FtsI family protein n=1 Tax=Blautia hansenii TaxID=1322 RepID=UPI000E3F600D|nr:peptidoglycan glycosyltransferase [Lachnospiraceae bacterium AM25-22]RGD09807.1 peptidoglycan glycosyltransferase [Lachnospiraceae bacterium AM25-11LB]RJW14682.1 peptidoglycan glycosyltransferase [Lachnospiraceae bacterium AM25-40]RJW18888.1 peptidoglycan glycosyltransferase [Lachnospiraceae bacterium AM25-39]
MRKNRTYHKKKTVLVFAVCIFLLAGLMGRMVYLMIIQSDYYAKKAEQLHERERDIKAARGRILDCKGEILADNKAVCTISVIHSQIKEPEKVVEMLHKELGISVEEAQKRVRTVSAIERVKTNVDKKTGDKIRSYGLDGVKVDEDFKRSYPFDELASKVLGFTGGDNQGIIGLEVMYEDVLKGINGKILTTTDARGIELSELGESRVEPVPGYDLHLSLDKNIQMYAQQAAEKVMEQKQADAVSILLLNPQNGEIYANANVPEFNLNEPFRLNTDTTGMTEKEKQDACNQMWRNLTINDTYEPGSTFKIITMAAGLSQGVVHPDDRFSCPGFKVVEDRRIHCHKRTGHGAENFVQGAMNSCNPVFIEVGLRLGVDNYYRYFQQFGLMKKTGIDLPGEAATIMHKKENIGEVELATISFGQSFQITPIQLATTVSSIINGGRRITPHFGVKVTDEEGNLVKELKYKEEPGIVSKEVSKEVCQILEKVVSEGSGKNAAIEGRSIGGKTATSQTLPRSANRYISSFLGFTPAENPKVLGICVIHNPQGIYYGGTIAAPVIKEIFENILPYMGIEG